MRFTPGFLPWSATACVLTFLSLATPVALSQDATKSKPKPHVSYEGPALTFDSISDEDMDNLGILASETAWDALLASLPQLPPKTPRTNVVLTPKELDSFVASYAFSSDVAKVQRKGNALEIEVTGHATSSNYLSLGKPVLLTPVATDEFEITGPREDRLHIDRDATGSIVGITLNPGLWAVHATRK